MKNKSILIGGIIGLMIGITTTIVFNILSHTSGGTTYFSRGILFKILMPFFIFNMFGLIHNSIISILIPLVSWILIGIVISIVIKGMNSLLNKISKRKIKKINRFFILLIIFEIIFIILLSFFKVSWPNPCVTPDFSHPFGKEMAPGTMCIQVIAPAPAPLFFLMQYLLILTMVIYLIYLGINKLKKLLK